MSKINITKTSQVSKKVSYKDSVKLSYLNYIDNEKSSVLDLIVGKDISKIINIYKEEFEKIKNIPKLKKLEKEKKYCCLKDYNYTFEDFLLDDYYGENIYNYEPKREYYYDIYDNEESIIVKETRIYYGFGWKRWREINQDYMEYMIENVYFNCLCIFK